MPNVICDRCGDESNAEPDTICGRYQGVGSGPPMFEPFYCTGIYRAPVVPWWAGPEGFQVEGGGAAVPYWVRYYEDDRYDDCYAWSAAIVPADDGPQLAKRGEACRMFIHNRQGEVAAAFTCEGPDMAALIAKRFEYVP